MRGRSFAAGITWTQFWAEPFTYADGTLTGKGNWVASDLDAGAWTIVSNTAQSSNSDAAGAANKDTTSLASVTFTNPWRFDFSIRCQDTATSAGCLVIFGDAGANGLYLEFNSGGDGVFVHHTATSQSTNASVTVTSDTAIRLQHVNRALTLSVGGSQVASLTLSSNVNLTDKRIEIYVPPPLGPTGRTWKLDSFVLSTGA